MIKKIITITLLAAFGFSIGKAQVVYSNDFLSIGVGARAHGMSNAVAATTNDAYSNYWNPAGLTQLESPFQIAAMHAEWFAGVAKFDYLGFVKPFNCLTIYSGVENILDIQYRNFASGINAAGRNIYFGAKYTL